MYSIYKIENKKNGKTYVGLTSNPTARMVKHFTDLETNRHHNKFLQSEYTNRENFTFEILEENIEEKDVSEKEILWIAKLDTYHNGYNQNPGGLGGHTCATNGGSKLTKTDIFIVNSVLEFVSRPGTIIGEFFNITNTTVYRIKQGKSHLLYTKEYKSLPLEKRKEIFQIFTSGNDFLKKKAETTIIKSKRKFNEKQVHLVLLNEERGRIVPLKRLARYLDVSGYTLDCILKRKSYQDFYLTYQSLNIEQKDKMASFLREKEKQTSRIAGTPLRATNHNISEKSV